MSVLLSSKVASQVLPQNDWIHPEEQLRRLNFPIANAVNDASKLIPEIANIIAEYADESNVTHWDTALKCLNMRPKKVPPLPWYIHYILNEKCPEEIAQRKADGTFCKIGEKCSLILVPEELGTINRFEKVAKSYGEELYPKNENPLEIGYFWDRAREEFGDIPFEPTHWELQTDDVLEGSESMSLEEQTALVHSLAEKTFVNWQIPGLQGSLAASVFRGITMKRPYSKHPTILKETSEDCPMLLHSCPIPLDTDFSGEGLSIREYDDDPVGVKVVRKFY